MPAEGLELPCSLAIAGLPLPARCLLLKLTTRGPSGGTRPGRMTERESRALGCSQRHQAGRCGLEPGADLLSHDQPERLSGAAGDLGRERLAGVETHPHPVAEGGE